MELDLILKKKSCKRNLVWPGGSSSGKIVLTLLAEIITLYVRLSKINVRRLVFEFILSK